MDSIENKCKLKDLKGKVAVVGMACRVPGANNLDEYWSLLSQGICAIKEKSDLRQQLDFCDYDKSNKNKCGYIDRIDEFDPAFFGITPREAIRMDPQQRHLLEVLWEAIEDAGINMRELVGYETGVFVGLGAMFGAAHYFMHQVNNNTADIYSYTGSECSTAANKISYIFDFRGPCFAIDSACSSSLTIVDEAYMRICSGKCRVAIVGSSSLLLSSYITKFFNNARLLTPDGQVKTFDEKANGYARGEGVGVIILKSLDQAIEDKNDIWAVISGTAVNHGGRNGRGFTYPDSEAQQMLIRGALKNAHLLPNEVRYIEAHGTATPVGDEIEIRGINNAISEGREEADFCKIGSVKTNIGHLEYASGIAALIKVCLMLKNKRLVPSLNFNKFNNNVDYKDLHVRVQTAYEPWPDDKKLIAGVSSFGIGGSNTHVVLESIENYFSDPCGNDSQNDSLNETYVFPLSSNGNLALCEIAKKYLDFIKQNSDITLQDICFSASVHRNHLKDRVAIQCENKQDLFIGLTEFVNKQSNSHIFQSEKTSLVSKDITFVFSDSRRKWLDKKTIELFDEAPFIDFIDEVDKAYQWLYKEAFPRIKKESDIEENLLISNIYYFIFQVILYHIWIGKGVKPDRLVGYRFGEIVSQYLAGNMSLISAFQMIEYYSNMQKEVSYSVFNIMASQEELSEILVDYKGEAIITAINSPNIQEVSVKNDCVDEFIKEIDSKGFYYKRLMDNSCLIINSFNSKHLKIKKIQDIKSGIKVYSTFVNEAGEYVDDLMFNGKEKNYLRTNFSKRINELADEGCRTFIEIGSDELLSFYITDIFQSIPSIEEREVIISSDNREMTLDSCIMKGIAELYVAGYSIEWEKIYSEGKFIKLPSYAWQHQSYWV